MVVCKVDWKVLMLVDQMVLKMVELQAVLLDVLSVIEKVESMDAQLVAMMEYHLVVEMVGMMVC